MFSLFNFTIQNNKRGGAGVLVFALIWCAGCIVALMYSNQLSMLMIIGVRYLAFNTLYGVKTYWALGHVLILSGILCIFLGGHFVIGAFVGGITGFIFLLVIFMQSKDSVLKAV